MQTRDEFVAERQPRWSRLEHLLRRDKALHSLPPSEISEVAALYRALCADLMRARALGVGPDVSAHLDSLAASAHNSLYGPRPYRLGVAVDVVLRRFPRAIRKNWRFMLVATILFGLPLGVGLVGALRSAEFAMGVLPGEMLEQMSEAYAEGFGSGRGSGTDTAMAGFYVYNNVGIAFRCFATGILFGTGSIFFLVYNGLVIGTVLGHVIASGAGTNILTFICGHAPFELVAIVVSGGAGLRMGYALIDTGGLTRLASLREAAGELLALISGAAVMLLIAALIEGFWSPSSIAEPVKWGFSAVGWLSVLGFFAFGGRGARRRVEPLRKRGDARPTDDDRTSPGTGPDSRGPGSRGADSRGVESHGPESRRYARVRRSA